MAAKRKTKKKITLSEFKTWLAGVQSMQPEEWHPSKENWKMILEQIDNITETVVTKEVVVEAERASHTAPSPSLLDAGNPAHAAPYAQPDRPAQQNHAPSKIPMSGNSASNRPAGSPQGENGLLTIEPPTGDGAYESSFT